MELGRRKRMSDEFLKLCVRRSGANIAHTLYIGYIALALKYVGTGCTDIQTHGHTHTGNERQTDRWI